MVRKTIRFLKGYVKIRTAGDSPERFLNLCSSRKIDIWDLTPRENTYEMHMSLKDFKSVRKIARKSHVRVYLTKRIGFPFLLQKYKHRKLFFAGACLCLCMIRLYSMMIWDIHFIGNEKWTDETLLRFLKTIEVTPAMPKSEVDCFEIVREIRQEYDDIVWVSASVDGSRLKIQIKENDDTFQEMQKETHPTDLVASQDGKITSIVTRAGTPMVHAGDEVKAGEVLVSGRVEVRNDAGEVTDYRYCQADADVWADTQMVYRDTISIFYEEKEYKRQSPIQVWAQAGKWRICLGAAGEEKKGEEQYTQIWKPKLGENFYLPVSFGLKTVKSYTTAQKKYTNKKIQEELSENFEQFSGELKEKGIQIRENSVKIHIDSETASAQGILYLNEKITRESDTEIIVMERNSKDESLRVDDGSAGGA